MKKTLATIYKKYKKNVSMMLNEGISSLIGKLREAKDDNKTSEETLFNDITKKIEWLKAIASDHDLKYLNTMAYIIVYKRDKGSSYILPKKYIGLKYSEIENWLIERKSSYLDINLESRIKLINKI